MSDSTILFCLYGHGLLFSKSSLHDEEMRKLYEEMEQQIKHERERVMHEVCCLYYNS